MPTDNNLVVHMNLPIRGKLSLIYACSFFVAILMTVTSVVGLQYRSLIYPTDELIGTFVANDAVNLLIGLPILLGSMWLAWRDRLIGLLCWMGALFFVFYNYTAYVFAMPLNWAFLLHIILMTLAAYALIAELHALPKDTDTYGLIHNDFNDGNFTVDYDNGDITVFDFDDSCYFWFMYDIACAWEGGIGRTMFRPLEERRDFMDRYMEQVMTGYNRENTLSAEWLDRLPLFLRLVQMQELMHFAQYMDDPDEELQSELRYKIHCIENDIPYMGFFDSVFNPEQPFTL